MVRDKIPPTHAKRHCQCLLAVNFSFKKISILPRVLSSHSSATYALCQTAVRNFKTALNKQDNTDERK